MTLQSELAEEEGNLQQERGKQDRLATSITDQMNKDSMVRKHVRYFSMRYDIHTS